MDLGEGLALCRRRLLELFPDGVVSSAVWREVDVPDEDDDYGEGVPVELLDVEFEDAGCALWGDGPPVRFTVSVGTTFGQGEHRIPFSRTIRMHVADLPRDGHARAEVERQVVALKARYDRLAGMAERVGADGS